MIGVVVMKAKHNSLDIMNQFNQTLPLADSVVFMPCVPSPLGVCA
ncbi:hypothetical protein [Faecalicatena contorta]|nr:hypothetical protein [Faecalicatena contorta]